MSATTAVQPAPNVSRHALASSLTIAALALTAAALRALCILRYRIDSDEPQHLHVAWSWARGLVAYRDFYDNHTPLFHLLFAPAVAVVGETPRILLIGRLLMLPLAAASLWLTYRLAARLFDETVARWTVLAAAVFPPLLLKSSEFRNDNLWVVFSLLAFWLATMPLTKPRAAALGAVVGLSLLTSIKTVFVAVPIALVAAAGGVSFPAILCGAIALLVPIALAAAWFAAHDALRPFLWCAVLINGELPVSAARRIAGAVLLALLAFVLIRSIRRAAGIDRTRRALLAAMIFFLGLVLAFSPLVSPRDLLPAFPILLMFGTAWLARRSAQALVPAVLALALLAFLDGRLWRRADDYQQRIVAQVLALTPPAEPVLDLKGETVFRERPSYIALEVVGRNALARGEVPETFSADVVARRCHVATRDNDMFPPRTRRFLQAYFIPLGDIRVAGSYVGGDGTFRIGVAGPYVPLAEDGTPAGPSRWYEPGVYRSAESAHAVIWTPAAQRTATLVAYHRPAARSFAGSTSRHVVHQPVSTVSTNSSGRRSARISAASRS